MRLIHTSELKSVNLLICLKPNQSVNQSADQAIRKARGQVTAIKIKHKVKTCSENSTATQNLNILLKKKQNWPSREFIFIRYCFESNWAISSSSANTAVTYSTSSNSWSSSPMVLLLLQHTVIWNMAGFPSASFLFIFIIINNNVKQKPWNASCLWLTRELRTECWCTHLCVSLCVCACMRVCTEFWQYVFVKNV